MNNFQVNPMQLVQMIQNGNNPQQLMLSILQQNAQNSPVYKNLVNMIEDGKTQDVEAVVRNIAKSQGIDFDKEFSNFKKVLGMK